MADPDTGDKESLSSINLGMASAFISGNYPTYSLKPIKSPDHVGVFTISIELTDDNPSAPMKSQFQLQVTVTEDSATATNSTSATAADSNSTTNSTTA